MEKKYGNQDEEDKKEIMEFYEYKQVDLNVNKKKKGVVETPKYTDY